MKKYLHPITISRTLTTALTAILLSCQSGDITAQSLSGNTGLQGNIWASAGGNQAQLSEEQLRQAKAENAALKTNAEGKARNNFTYFSQTSINSSAEVKKYNSGNEQHPELGIMFADAPCNDCYELIDKRTPTQKYFVKEGSETRSFAVQSYQYPVHYKDASGRWMTITGHLEKDSKEDGIYITKGRPVNTLINTKEGYSKLSGADGSLTYNRDVELVYIQPDGTEMPLGKANWSNYTAGDDGVRVINAWPGIDMEMGVLVNSLKTNFIVKSPMPAYAAGKLVLRDHVMASNGLSMQIRKGQVVNGTIPVVNAKGEQAFVINRAIAYEQIAGENAATELNYKGNADNVLDIEVPGALLGKSAASYPLVIDPLVAGTLSSGFTYTSGTFPPAFASTSEYCTNTNNVGIPAAATLSDIQITYNYYGPPATSWGQSRLAFQVNGGCTYGWLSCSAAAFSSGIPGNTCGLLNTSYWSTGGSWGTTSGCLPAYNCNAYTLPFQLLLTQQNTSTAACAQTVYATASGFTVTVFGTTAMLPSITLSGSPLVCMPSTITLTGSPVTGTWSSSATGVATVSAGTVTGVTNGTANITYTASGCTSFINVTVGTTPTVSGATAICFPGSTTLTGTPSGGTWTSSLPSIATITSGGLVNAVAIGTTIINYNTGTCSLNRPFDVNSPAAVAPTTQPTGITFSGVTSSGATINFTPNSSTGYLVVASTSPTLSASPVTYTTYATGSSFGGGIVVQGSTSGSSPSYTTSLLNSNTYYYIFVFAFNNNCVGPQYNTVTPLTGTFNTCVGATSVPTVVSAGVNILNLSWTASPTGGGYISPINYTVYVYSDAACTALVPGYPMAAGTGTTYTATGLATGTQYWIRVSPADACAIMSPIGSGMTSCTSAGSIPYLQTFEVATTLGDRSPNCMTSNVQNCVFSGVQTTVTFIGTINTNHTAGGTKFYNFFRGGACSAGWANQWLLLPGLAMTAGTTYTLSFWYRTDGAAWTSMTAHYSTTSTVPAVGSTTMGGSPGTIGSGFSGVTTTTYTQYIQNFTVPSSGTYYIGLDAASTSGGLLAIDDIEVCAVPTVVATASPAPFCLPDTVNLSSTGTSGATVYNWAGPSGYSSTVTTPLPLIGLPAGTYIYTLSATSDPISAGFGGYCTASVTTTFTINTPPSAISGTTSICTGQTTTLTNTTSGGTWSSSNTAVGTINSGGVFGGVGAGTTTVTYDVGGCYATIVMTVTAMPTPITGILIACLGSTTVLSSTPSGGTWYCVGCTSASVGSTTGLVTGLALGTCVITYSSLSGSSCYVTAVVTTNPAPTPITGSFSICVGTTSTLSSTPSPGIWTSSTPAIASVGAVSGIVSGNAVGTANITYTSSGCRAVQTVTVVAGTAPIVGPSTVCLYYPTVTYTNPSPGGTWSSSNANVSIGSSSGIATGNFTGTSTITYSLSAGCTATMVVTVLPAPAAITGTLSICEAGGTTTLSHPVSGGTWSSPSPNITIGLGTGFVTGLTAGTAVVTYSLPSGCAAIATVTVNALPAPITGTLSICVGGSSTLSSATAGVTWISGTPAVATIGVGTGIVNGIAAGTSAITCTNSFGCQVTAVVTVDPVPAPITGTYSVCVGSTTLLSCATPFVVWSSSTPLVATVSGSGLVSGLNPGTSTITATNAGSCSTSVVVTVSASPVAITGTPTLCVGFTTSLACTTPGGIWSSSSPSIANILSPGLIGGVAPGTATISYTVAGCSSTQIVTVNTLPGSISGTLTVCQGSTTALSNSVSGGTWSSVTTTIGTIGSTTGIFTGLASGTTVISYSLGSGCAVSAVATVNPLPAVIGGTLGLCEGTTTALTGSAGTVWSASCPGILTVSPGGTVSAIGAGTCTVTSIFATTGCARTAVVTVNALPGVISGGSNICVGATTTLTSTPAGGTWTSSNGNATVIGSSGVVTGAFAGTSTLTYTLPTGCYRTTIIAVSALPTGTTPSGSGLQVCEGSVLTVTGSPAGGTWVSGTPAVGTISTGSGNLGGITAGTTVLTYTSALGCSLTATATVNALPGAIGGVLTTCVGQQTTLNSIPATGTWAVSSGTGSASIVSGTGVLTGTTAGTVSVTYTLPTGCRRMTTVTVFALPGTITGGTNVCVSSTSTLNCTPTGGTWSMTCSYATIGVTTGIVAGTSIGTCDVTYTLGTGCIRTATITVNSLPTPITGSLTTCVGQSTTLSSSPAGTWSISPTSVATVVPTTGVVTGISGGTGSATATVTYTIPTGCRVTDQVTVYALPSPIGGSLQVCVNGTTTLTTTTPGGTWASSNTAVGTINTSTGALTGLLAGTTTITYSLGTGCYVTATATVNALPAPISGTFVICHLNSTTLTNSTGGGTWSSTIPANAPITSGGVVSGANPGTSTISYTVGTGCASTTVMTVIALPSAITGPSAVCVNSTITLASTPLGGTWSSPHSTVAVNPVTGDVTGLVAGTATIIYTAGTGCASQKNITVNPLPNPITGNPAVCFGNTTLLATTSTTGTWSSTIPGIATIDAAGLVTSVAVGTTTISYTLPVTGCASTVNVTVNSLPTPITGSSGFCNLSSTTYMSSSTNGVFWFSLNTGVLTIDMLTGVATGVTVDTTFVIAEDQLTGCSVSKKVFLILAPYAISGPVDVCLGQCTALGNVITGGIWSSSNPSVASVDPTGLVCGLSLGTTNITYVLSTGCSSSQTMTVNPIPVSIIGSSQICEGSCTTLSNATPGGTWTSGNPLVLTIDPSSGLACGISGGTATVTYALGTGCNATVVMTVNPLPGAITGSLQVCEGSTTTLSSSTPGGIWSSADPLVASIDPSTGVMTGMSAATMGVGGIGMTIITYSLPVTGCQRTENVTVNPLPSGISGVVNICEGNGTVFVNATPGGAWISSNPAIGTIDPATGAFIAISAGCLTISYLLPTGCVATWPLCVQANPAPIGGSLSVCAGFATNLTSGPAGGTWSQGPGSASFGTIHSVTGVVSGIVAGIIPVTYTLGTGCRAVNEVTVVTLPAVIGGAAQVCVGGTTVLTNPVGGGVWTSSNIARATIDPVTGIVSGLSAGTAVITYTVGTGCFNVRTITVNPLPAVITGPLQVCEGSTVVLSSTSPGGLWISGNTSVATAGITSGIISGISAGVANISYSFSTGCMQVVQMTVNATPAPIMGNVHICMGTSNTFTSTSAGGVWYSSNPAIATIDPSSGVATSVSVGSVTISYVYPSTGCMATKVVSVQPLPVVYNVTGGGNYCSGGIGVHVNLSGSQPGVSYELYYGSSATGFTPGTGFPIDFGLHTLGGTYTVQATNVTSGCKRNMTGSATIIVNPLVTPSVTINTAPYDSVCPGQSVTLTPAPVNGGSAPAYLWKVNGTTVSTASVYAFAPANGDNVTVTMTSNASCLATAVVTGVKTLTVLPNEMPVAGMLATPGDTICQYSPVTLTAAPMFGGPSPSYTWLVNGIVKGGGPTYSYVPVDGDVVNLRMTSDYRCRLANTVTSEDLALSVDPLLIPHVTIAPEPGLAVEAGKPITLHAVVTDGGTNPKYQWKVNGKAIAGATTGSYTAIFNDYDSIACEIISGGVCGNIGTSDWVFITMWQLATHQPIKGATDIRLVPNPNKGVFTIKGTFSAGIDEEVNADVTDMLGQVVYRGVLKAKQGRIDTQVQLENNLANGMYILTLRTGTEQKVFHFVMEQ